MIQEEVHEDDTKAMNQLQIDFFKSKLEVVKEIFRTNGHEYGITLESFLDFLEANDLEKLKYAFIHFCNVTDLLSLILHFSPTGMAIYEKVKMKFVSFSIEELKTICLLIEYIKSLPHHSKHQNDYILLLCHIYVDMRKVLLPLVNRVIDRKYNLGLAEDLGNFLLLKQTETILESIHAIHKKLKELIVLKSGALPPQIVTDLQSVFFEKEIIQVEGSGGFQNFLDEIDELSMKWDPNYFHAPFTSITTGSMMGKNRYSYELGKHLFTIYCCFRHENMKAQPKRSPNICTKLLASSAYSNFLAYEMASLKMLYDFLAERKSKDMSKLLSEWSKRQFLEHEEEECTIFWAQLVSHMEDIFEKRNVLSFGTN